MEYFYQYLIDAVNDLQTDYGHRFEFLRPEWGTDIWVYPQGEIQKSDFPKHLCIIRNLGDKREWFVIKNIPDEYRGESATILGSGYTPAEALRQFLEEPEPVGVGEV